MGLRLLLVVFIVSSSFGFSQTAIGDIETYVGTIIDTAPGSSGDNYDEPNATQLIIWNGIVTNILDENISTARTSANNLNYQVTEFTDTSISSNQIFYVLEEKSPQLHYWGTYVFSKTPTRNNLIIQAPHSRYDTNTGKQAVYCFKNNVARAVFINGTHRCNSNSFSSCSGTTGVCGTSGQSYRISDQAHVTNAMFQKTTENLLIAISNSVFIQLHGFGKRSTDPYVIMSNGTRETPTTDYVALIRDALLIEDNTLTFEIAHINTSWTRLIAFTNTQGRLINNSSNHCSTSATTTTGRFIHVEQERTKLRDNATGWGKMSNALSSVFESTLSTEEFNLSNNVSISPNPTSGIVFINGKQINQIEVYNLYGQKIKIQKNNSSSIDLKSQSSGMYFFKIKTDKGIVSKKIIRL